MTEPRDMGGLRPQGSAPGTDLSGTGASGPYIVTVTRACNCTPSVCESDDLLYHEMSCAVGGVARGDRATRRAVATLEEARRWVTRAISDSGRKAGSTDYATAAGMGEGGCSLGPLPDGTVIEVERGGWDWLATDAGLGRTVLGHMAACGDAKAQQSVLTAYNAAHGSQSS